MTRFPWIGALAAPAAALLLGSCQSPFDAVSVRPIWAYEDGCVAATLYGTGFEAGGYQVLWGGEPIPAAWPVGDDDGVDDQGYRLDIESVPPGEVGSVDVVVEQGGVVDEILTGFTYAACSPRPRVDLAWLLDGEGDPVDWSPIEGGVQLVIEGCGYSAGTTVSIGGQPANVAAASCSTGLVVDVPPGLAWGPALVEVTNGEGEVNADWTIDYNCDGPGFSGIDPLAYDTAAGGTGLVSGCGFFDDGITRTRALLDVPFPDANPFAGTELGVTVLDPFTLEIAIPPYPLGLADLTLANPDPADPTGTLWLAQTTVPDALVFGVPLSVSAIAPDQGALAGGYRVDVYGTGFDFLTSVAWDGVPLQAGEWFLVSTQQLFVVAAPAGASPGPVAITVSHPFAGIGEGTFIYLADAE